ncbi:MAG: hypothetical protein RMA76_11415 [Deltaproteobacteria bacterium]
MSSPAEMPHADEALKALVARFKEAPGSSACTELASALLARGHASEALRVAEHGLQLVPGQVDGRVERAAALLALGRPRVAYVELRRALAIDPTHRRGMRLLGKAYRDAGAPGRAAALLAKRSMDPDYEAPPPPKPTKKKKKEQWRQRPAIDNDPTVPVSPSDGAIPELFSALTKDLGLGAAVPETTAPRRVEVTQIIRRKGLLRPPRSASELAEIDGPIVDTTQPGHILDSEIDELAQEVTTREPAPLFSAGSGAGLNAFALDDEPLFQEDMPFAVRPVDGASTDIEPVLDDDDPVDAPTDQIQAFDEDRDRAATKPGDTLVDDLEEGTDPLEALQPAPTSPLVPDGEPNPRIRRFVAGKEKRRPEGDAPAFEGGAPVVERRGPKQQRLEIVDPPANRTHLLLAVACAIAMLVYFVGLGFYLQDGIRPWFGGAADKGRTEAPARVDDEPAKSARVAP